MSELAPRTSPTALFEAIERVKARLTAVESRPIAAAPVSLPTIQQLSASWTDPINKTYWLVARADRAYTIKRITAQLVSGTCTLQLVTSAGNLGSSVACSSTQSTNVVSLALAAGEFLKVTLSAVTSAVDLVLTVDYE